MADTDQRATWVPGAAVTSPRLDAPIVVLTCGRSGSTLLRFLLDAHPALACPPETGLIDLSMRMSVLSRLLDGPQSGSRQGLSNLGVVSIRNWVSVTFGAYLTKVGKQRWCDKSLGSAESADKFLEIFPAAKFICLYRNCMDVVDSALEACPFGLRGYGLDPFVSSHPGNSVAAVADYWVSHTRAIVRFEKAHPECCFRLRYEDFVADPEGTAAKLFDFLGEEQVPGISAACLRQDKDTFGPSDHKIFMTSEITDSSVGRGRRLPHKMINAPMTALINGLHEDLGYPALAEGWETQPPVLPAEKPSEAAAASPLHLALEKLSAAGGLNIDDLEHLLAERVSAWSGPGPALAAGAGGFSIAVTVPGNASAARRVACRWDLDLDAKTMSRSDAALAQLSPSEPGAWAFAGDLDAFESVLTGRLNLASAMRNGLLRIVEARREEELASRPRATISFPLMQGEPRVKILRELLRPRAVLAATAGQGG
jgi:protein-tyrosine sulfotransferase